MLDNTNFNQKPLLDNVPEEVWFSKKNLLHYIIIFILVIVIIGGWLNYKPFDSTELENRITQSEIRYDSISKENKLFKDKIIYFEDKIKDIDIKLNKNYIQINNLKQEVDEKVNAIDTYSYDKLKQFITDRYN